MVAPRPGEQDGPHGEPICELYWVILLFERSICLLDELIDAFVHVIILLLNFWSMKPLQERIHGSHDKRMSCKSTNDIGYSCCLSWITPSHKVLWTADHANWEASTKCLSVADEVCVDIVCTLSAPWMEAEASVHFIKEEENACLVAELSQLVQPFLVSSCGTNLAVVGGKHWVTGWRLIQMEALQGVDQHSCNFTLSCFQDR
mmetsp:Transcript_57339/g.100440  ORF Transcript_57339/g.100440 Transcript_57339/m.100440 type:complete len:203 (-) Transcript_57339:1056-1664(-)